MIKTYTETQYKVYSSFMDQLANTDDMQNNIKVYTELNEWLEDNAITGQAIEQMENRIYKEDMI